MRRQNKQTASRISKLTLRNHLQSTKAKQPELSCLELTLLVESFGSGSRLLFTTPITSSRRAWPCPLPHADKAAGRSAAGGAGTPSPGRIYLPRGRRRAERGADGSRSPHSRQRAPSSFPNSPRALRSQPRPDGTASLRAHTCRQLKKPAD